MLLKLHFNELKYRIIYLIISLLITYLIIINFNSYILLMFSPNIQTFIMFSNIIDGILLKWTVSLYLAFWFVFPYIIYSLWSFIRPGLFKLEEIGTGQLITLIWLLPLVIYFSIIAIYNYYLIDFIMPNTSLNNNVENSVVTMERYLPTLLQIVMLIKNIIIFSLFITVSLLTLIYFNFINVSIYVKYRFHIWFVFLSFLSFFLPPDLLVLLITAVITIIVLEVLLFIILIFKIYSKVSVVN